MDSGAKSISSKPISSPVLEADNCIGKTGFLTNCEIMDINKLKVYAAQGDANALYELGRSLLSGYRYGEVDFKRGKSLLIKAAIYGHPEAQSELNFGIASRGNIEDFDNNLRLALKGDPQAQVVVALSYFFGPGDKRPNPIMAVAWYNIALKSRQTIPEGEVFNFIKSQLSQDERDLVERAILQIRPLLVP